MRSQARTVTEYLEEVPVDRRPHLERLRQVVKKAVPASEEGMAWGMLCYTVKDRPFAALASQKGYLSLYLMDLYTQPGLRQKHAAALAPLKMGKSCINFQSVEELPLDAIRAILKEAPAVVVTSGTLAAKRRPAKSRRKRNGVQAK